METSTSLELTEIIPLALVIALSPLSIIPAVLILQSPRPRPSGLAFLAGWVCGLTALTAVFIGASNLVAQRSGHPPLWSYWTRVAVGAALIVWGVYRWLTRHGSAHEIPGTKHLTEAGPAKALTIGAALTALNPKVLFICLAAGLAIGASGIGSEKYWVAVVFVAVSASTVALPILAYAVSGEQLEPALARVGAWMEKHSAALMAAILVIIGLMVLYKGVHGL
ncbi:MAG: GAP family protein [Mycobacterium sp.]|mgnify:FL=1